MERLKIKICKNCKEVEKSRDIIQDFLACHYHHTRMGHIKQVSKPEGKREEQGPKEKEKTQISGEKKLKQSLNRVKASLCYLETLMTIFSGFCERAACVLWYLGFPQHVDNKGKTQGSDILKKMMMMRMMMMMMMMKVGGS